ncbi:YCF48-related protein [Bacteroidota bacterium]
MKHLNFTFTLSILFILFSSNVVKSQEFYWQNPLPAGNSMNAISFFNNSKAFIAGGKGMILKTEDGGANWDYKQICEENLSDIHMISSDVVVTVGTNHTIMRTSDGGSSWNEVYRDTNNYLIRDLHFVDENGWAVGDSGIILSTTDNGETWSKNKLPYNILLYAVHFTSDQHGWVSGWYDGEWFTTDPVLFKTVDGGKTWTSVDAQAYSMPLKQVQFIDDNIGYIGDGYQTLRKTTDGGLTWTTIALDIENDMMHFQFLDENNGWAIGGTQVGNSECIYKTTDGGQSWEKIKYGTRVYLSRVHAISTSEFWAIGWAGIILHSTDGGNTINLMSNAETYASQIYDIFFVDENHGWAAGVFGKLHKTTNGGSTWTECYSGSGSFHKVYFIDKEKGWAAGGSWTDAKILKTTDGGENWDLNYSSDIGRILNIYFSDENNGVAIGNKGILRTSDGGSTWTGINTNDKTYNFGYSCIYDLDTWYITYSYTGEYNHMLYTKDGGQTWTEKEQVFEYYGMNSVDFISKDSGWVSGWQNQIAKTTDGGDTWTLIQEVTVNRMVYDIDFIDENRGWYSNSFGEVFASEDGGLSWEKVSSIAQNYMFTIFVLDPEHIWAAGSENTIISTVQPVGIPSTVPSIALDNNTTLNIYPNPSSNFIRISKFDVISSASYDIYNLTGQRIKQGQLVNTNVIDLVDLKSGVYILRITLGDVVRTQKFVKQ